MSRFVPLSLRGYERSWVRADIVAGLTLAAVAVPETMGYTSIAQVFDDHVPLVPVGWLVSDPYRTETLVADLSGPVLIVHGSEDEVIGVEHGRALAALLGPRAQLVVLNGRHHNDLWEERRTVVTVRGLVESLSSR